MHVEREHLSQLKEFLQGFVDEYDADESSKSLLCESSDVAHQRAGVCGNQQNAQECRPQADAGAQGEVGQTVLTGEREEHMLYHFRNLTDKITCEP